MEKKVKIIAGLFLAVILSTAGAYAAFSDSLNIVNHISVGDISISVSEYARKGNGEIKYKAPDEVLPGQIISKIPRIKNMALPCWIRAKIVFGGGNTECKGLSEENIHDISTDWVRRGEYYYYTKILRKQETTDLFQKISIPETWTEEHALQKLTVDIQVDAIQAANFRPDFDAMSPWGNQVIQQCIHEQDGTLTCKKGAAKLSVEFSGKAHKLIAVPDDFFTNLETAMPGDILTDSIEISNTTKQEVEIYFRTSTEGRTEAQIQMLKEIPFQIRQNRKVLYKGSLDSEKLTRMQSLGSFAAGQKDRLEFQLKIPEDWDNAYALRKTDVTWIFAVNEEKPSGQKSGEETGSDRKKGSPAKKKDFESKRRKAIKTGDVSEILPAVILLLGAASAVLLIRRFKGGKET